MLLPSLSISIINKYDAHVLMKPCNKLKTDQDDDNISQALLNNDERILEYRLVVIKIFYLFMKQILLICTIIFILLQSVEIIRHICNKLFGQFSF